MRNLTQNNFRRILVVNVNWAGDVVFSSAVFEALHEAYPQARISCLAAPRVQEVLESIPFVHEIISYEERGRHKNPWGKLKLIGGLKKKKFDAAFLLHRSLTRALLIFLAGIPVRVGYNTKGRGVFLTRRVPEPSGSLHRQDYYLNLLEAFGIPVKKRESLLAVDLESTKQMNQRLCEFSIEEKDFLLVLNPGGNWDLKRWPKENWTKLIELFLKEFHGQSNFKIILSGSEKDISLVDEILAPLHLNNYSKVANLTGKWTLKELITFLKRSNLLISADSGPLHMASSVGTKTIGIFGPTSPDVTGPRGSGSSQILKVDVGCNRSPCYYLQCPENTCMRAVTVQDVFGLVREWISY